MKMAIQMLPPQPNVVSAIWIYCKMSAPAKVNDRLGLLDLQRMQAGVSHVAHRSLANLQDWLTKNSRIVSESVVSNASKLCNDLIPTCSPQLADRASLERILAALH